ncbi:major vault protein [Aplysia californica]|uniref:Major vault protein n=1 Tax=Aplysia californica TaxID=6500 RepID=A0ABM0ZY61_APLCA|nr:major vault protein [Aplysia californica]
MSNLARMSPLQFVHVLDLNKNLMRLEVGPQTLLLKTNEKLITGPMPMIVIPPGSYCEISDPVKAYVHGEKCELLLGQTKIKFHGKPFPLYPGEWLKAAPDFARGLTNYSAAVKSLPVVPENHGIRLRAILDHDDSGTFRNAGDIWQLKGPMTYKPRPEVAIEGIDAPKIIKKGQVLKLKATQGTIDASGKQRVTGEEWLVKEPGAYLPGVFEEPVILDKVVTLTHDTALHLKATQNIVDLLGKPRKTGDEWLLTSASSPEYSTQIGVEVVATLKITVVKKGQYAVVLNPVDKDGKPQLGKRVLKVGLCRFFLHPGEKLEFGKIQDARVLSEDDSVVLQALDKFIDTVGEAKVKREPGDKWLIKGPMIYIPPIHVKIVKQRKKIPLSKNEGVYIQDAHSGRVRLVMGPCAYMLTATEDLWQKELSNETENLLRHGGGSGEGDIRKLAYYEQSIDPMNAEGRDKTKVVTYRCPSNTAVQVYDYLQKTARVIFGPDLVVLGPHENFNVLSLSAGKPKLPNALKSLCLMLGPDFITDVIEVETSDHARLRIRLAFNNYFDVDKTDLESTRKIFSVPDFIGFACRQIASRIRASVALITFDEFHRHSAQLIQAAVFGKQQSLRFDVNNLVISGIDVQSIEPSDAKMRDSLSKSVQLAIEIATNSIEAAASHEAQREEQIAKGHLERQILVTEKESERERAKLYELRALASAVESTGQAKAEAQAKAERFLIECQSQIDAARLKAEASQIEHDAKLQFENKLRRQTLDYQKKMNSITIGKENAFAQLETNKFRQMVQTLGTDTLVAIANAGPESQVNLLKGLGLESVLLTDGNSPINLLNTASGLVGGQNPQE